MRFEMSPEGSGDYWDDAALPKASRLPDPSDIARRIIAEYEAAVERHRAELAAPYEPIPPGDTLLSPFTSAPDDADTVRRTTETLNDHHEAAVEAIAGIFAAASDGSIAWDALAGQVQYAAETVADLARTEESALVTAHLWDDARLREAFHLTRGVERDLRDFLHAHPGTPKPVTLEAVSPAHGRVRVTGLARFFPARTVISKDNVTVVAGDNCTLQSVDHYHVRQVTMPLDPLLEPGSQAHTALLGLIEDHSDAGIRQFQGTLRRLIEPSHHRDTRATLPIKNDPVMLITGSELVHRGDGSDVAVTTRYEIQRSELPAIELLANNPQLVQSFVAAVTEPEPAAATRRFLREALTAAGHADDLSLVDHSTDLDGPTTSAWALFGVDTVRDAAAVMVGSGNKLVADMQVDRGDFTRRTVLDGLSEIREAFAAEAPSPPSPELSDIFEVELPEPISHATLDALCRHRDYPTPANGPEDDDPWDLSPHIRL
jgi:hypothetical protein